MQNPSAGWESSVGSTVNKLPPRSLWVHGRVLILTVAASHQMMTEKAPSLINYEDTQKRKQGDQIRSNLSGFGGEFYWFMSFFWCFFFFSLCYSQAGCISCTTLIFLAKETRATTFWQLPRLLWLIESGSEHMHTHRHTPTHTVGGDGQLRGGTHSHTCCIREEMRTQAEMLAGGWIGSKQDTDKCAANAIHVLLFVINHAMLLPAKKMPLCQCDKNLCTI